MSHNESNLDLKIDPDSVARSKKLKYLADMSEDDFRDRVVRPVLQRGGLQWSSPEYV